MNLWYKFRWRCLFKKKDELEHYKLMLFHNLGRERERVRERQTDRQTENLSLSGDVRGKKTRDRER